MLENKKLLNLYTYFITALQYACDIRLWMTKLIGSNFNTKDYLIIFIVTVLKLLPISLVICNCMSFVYCKVVLFIQIQQFYVLKQQYINERNVTVFTGCRKQRELPNIHVKKLRSTMKLRPEKLICVFFTWLLFRGKDCKISISRQNFIQYRKYFCFL